MRDLEEYFSIEDFLDAQMTLDVWDELEALRIEKANEAAKR